MSSALTGVRRRQKISPDDLEAMLKILPDPKYVIVRLINFDYASLVAQAQEQLEGIILNDLLESRVQNPTNQLLLEIYRKTYNTPTNLSPSGKAVLLKEAGWSTSKDEIVRFAPTRVTIQYRGGESEYIRRLISVLQENNIRFRVHVYSSELSFR